MSGPYLRHRRHREEEELNEPLLQAIESISDDEGSIELKGHAGGRRALVPHDINRVDWQLLWQTLIESCSRSFSSIWVTLASCFGSILPHQQPLQLSLIQEERLQQLRDRIQVPFDADDPDHQAALERIWQLAFPGTPFTGMVNDMWTEMGWQRNDPRSDFRGAGFTSLENHLYMAQNESQLWERLLQKAVGERSEWEYPFAVGGINVTFMLEELVEMRDARTAAPVLDRLPATPAARGFLGLLRTSETAFEEVYCLAYEVLDGEWLQMRASYMDFPAVIKRVRARLADALATHPTSTAELRTLLLPPTYP